MKSMTIYTQNHKPGNTLESNINMAKFVVTEIIQYTKNGVNVEILRKSQMKAEDEGLQ